MVASGFGVVQSWSRIRGHRGCAQGGGGDVALVLSRICF